MRAQSFFGIVAVALLGASGGCSTLFSSSPPAPAPPPPKRDRAPEQGIWISRGQVKRLPMGGTAWERLKAAADGSLGKAEISDQNSDHDVRTLAVALVYARTGDDRYREKAAQAISDAVGTEQGGNILALGRNLLSYILAADLIDFRTYDPGREAQFRRWLEGVRREPLGSEAVSEQTLVGSAERAPNNSGGMAAASRVAAAIYLRDESDLGRAAQVMKGWLGDGAAYPGIPSASFDSSDADRGYRFGGYNDDLSWQADPAHPVGVNPAGADKDGHSIDGALPDDMRRGGSFQWPPKYTQYPREALSAYVPLAEMLYRQGYDVYRWSNRALLRATRFLYALGQQFPDAGWWEPQVPVYWIIDYRYRAHLPVMSPVGIARNIGWTDWTHAGSRS